MITWGFGWKDFTITYKGKEVGKIPSLGFLSDGREFRLKDGSTLSVKLTRNLASVNLEVLRNGKPVPGSDTDPARQLDNVYTAIGLLAFVYILLGALALIFDIEYLKNSGVGLATIGFGGILYILGVLVKRGSMPAMIFTVVTIAAEYAASFYLRLQSGGGDVGGSIGAVIRLMIILYIWKGFKAIRRLKKNS